jgi:hypothetical protein
VTLTVRDNDSTAVPRVDSGRPVNDSLSTPASGVELAGKVLARVLADLAPLVEAGHPVARECSEKLRASLEDPDS